MDLRMPLNKVRKLFKRLARIRRKTKILNLKMRFRRNFQDADEDMSGELDAIEIQNAIRNGGV